MLAAAEDAEVSIGLDAEVVVVVPLAVVAEGAVVVAAEDARAGLAVAAALLLALATASHGALLSTPMLHAAARPLPLAASARRHAAAAATRRRISVLPRACAAADADADPEREEKLEKALKAMVGFSNSYCKSTDTRYCSDASIPAVVIKGLAEHKVLLGAPLCPCRHYEDKAAEAKDGYWNCPCVPMRERHECHCMLFLTKDNEFAGDNQALTVQETKDYTDGMSIL